MVAIQKILEAYLKKKIVYSKILKFSIQFVFPRVGLIVFFRFNYFFSIQYVERVNLLNIYRPAIILICVTRDMTHKSK